MDSFPKQPSQAAASIEASSLQLFDPSREQESAPTQKKYFSQERIFNFLTQSALVVGFLGFGWALSAQFFETSASKDAQRAQNAAKTQQSEIATLSAEIASLKETVEATRAAAKTQNSDEVKTLKKSLDSVKAGLEAVKTETNATIAQLGAKFDHLQHDPGAKLQQIADRLEHIEKQVGNTTAAAGTSIAAKSSAHPLAPPPPPVQKISSVSHSGGYADTDRPFPLITSWVVRDVYDGIALVEGEYGAIQVGPGENIPGAGKVKSIEKRGNGWIVITSRGFVDSAHD